MIFLPMRAVVPERDRQPRIMRLIAIAVATLVAGCSVPNTSPRVIINDRANLVAPIERQRLEQEFDVFSRHKRVIVGLTSVDTAPAPASISSTSRRASRKFVDANNIAGHETIVFVLLRTPPFLTVEFEGQAGPKALFADIAGSQNLFDIQAAVKRDSELPSAIAKVLQLMEARYPIGRIGAILAKCAPEAAYTATGPDRGLTLARRDCDATTTGIFKTLPWLDITSSQITHDLTDYSMRWALNDEDLTRVPLRIGLWLLLSISWLSHIAGGSVLWLYIAIGLITFIALRASELVGLMGGAQSRVRLLSGIGWAFWLFVFLPVLAGILFLNGADYEEYELIRTTMGLSSVQDVARLHNLAGSTAKFADPQLLVQMVFLWATARYLPQMLAYGASLSRNRFRAQLGTRYLIIENLMVRMAAIFKALGRVNHRASGLRGQLRENNSAIGELVRNPNPEDVRFEAEQYTSYHWIMLQAAGRSAVGALMPFGLLVIYATHAAVRATIHLLWLSYWLIRGPVATPQRGHLRATARERLDRTQIKG